MHSETKWDKFGHLYHPGHPADKCTLCQYSLFTNITFWKFTEWVTIKILTEIGSTSTGVLIAVKMGKLLWCHASTLDFPEKWITKIRRFIILKVFDQFDQNFSV